MTSVTEISLFVFHSFSTRVSNELGAGHPAAAKLAGCVVMTMVTIHGVVVGTFFILIRDVWGYAFSNEQEVVEYLAKMLPIVAVSEFFSGLQCVLSGYHSIICYNYIYIFSTSYVLFHLTSSSLGMKFVEVELNDCD